MSSETKYFSGNIRVIPYIILKSIFYFPLPITFDDCTSPIVDYNLHSSSIITPFSVTTDQVVSFDFEIPSMELRDRTSLAKNNIMQEEVKLALQPQFQPPSAGS